MITRWSAISESTISDWTPCCLICCCIDCTIAGTKVRVGKSRSSHNTSENDSNVISFSKSKYNTFLKFDVSRFYRGKKPWSTIDDIAFQLPAMHSERKLLCRRYNKLIVSLESPHQSECICFIYTILVPSESISQFLSINLYVKSYWN